MSKKEVIFPLNTIGGKIQHIRKENNLDRIQFYNSINPNDTFIKDDSKYKTVYNWESSKAQPSFETITAICNEFNVSSDFLLGIQKEKNNDIYFKGGKSMKKLEIHIDDKYADVVTITAIGMQRDGIIAETNVTVNAINLSEHNILIINEDGLANKFHLNE